MTKNQFEAFSEFRFEFKSYCKNLNDTFSNDLAPLVKEAAKADTPDYPLETAVVYNTALDEITAESQINLIVIGDNPGKDEQLSKNNKYLVGQSGKIAAGFFTRNPQLRTDFRKNVIILNKTPVHTAKTKHLKFLEKNGGTEIKKLIAEYKKNGMADVGEKVWAGDRHEIFNELDGDEAVKDVIKWLCDRAS